MVVEWFFKRSAYSEKYAISDAVQAHLEVLCLFLKTAHYFVGDYLSDKYRSDLSSLPGAVGCVGPTQACGL